MDGARRAAPLRAYGHAPLRRIWKELGLDRKIRQLKQDVDIEPAVFFLVALTIMGVSFEERDFFLGDPAAGLTERHLAAARTFLEENRDGLQCWLTKKLHDRFGRAVSVSPPISSMPEGGLQTRLSERHELEKPERLDGVGLFTVLDLELK